MVQAYILIQTEVGRAAAVASEVAGIDGVTRAEDVTGPYDVIVHVEAADVDVARREGHRRRAEGPRHHAHPDLPRGVGRGPVRHGLIPRPR